MTAIEVDQGTAFGTWTDPVSRFMYHESLLEILPLLNIEGTVGDFGGANGLLKQYLPNVTTIDNDESKKPDIVDDILTHRGYYDVAWCRYVLHYLTDVQVRKFVYSVQAPRVVIVQFVNDDLLAKVGNSYKERKYFRTAEQMKSLLPVWATEVYSRDYTVTAEFYKNRLGLEDAVEHQETLKVYEF